MRGLMFLVLFVSLGLGCIQFNIYMKNAKRPVEKFTLTEAIVKVKCDHGVYWVNEGRVTDDICSFINYQEKSYE